jgi:hypothetical protein
MSVVGYLHQAATAREHHHHQQQQTQWLPADYLLPAVTPLLHNSLAHVREDLFIHVLANA